MSKIKGRNLLVLLENDSGGYEVTACAVTCELDMTTEVKEVSSPGQCDWKKYRKRLRDWKVSSQHLISLMNVELLSSMEGRDVMLRFNTTDESDEAREAQTRSYTLTFNRRGRATCNRATIQARNKDKVNGSFEFIGVGWLTSIEPNAAFTQGYTWDEDYIDETGAIQENI